MLLTWTACESQTEFLKSPHLNCKNGPKALKWTVKTLGHEVLAVVKTDEETG